VFWLASGGQFGRVDRKGFFLIDGRNCASLCHSLGLAGTAGGCSFFSGTDRGATQRGPGTGRRIGRVDECANEEDGARRLLLRAAFKQSVADLLRYEALRPLPCLVIVTAELEVLSEHDALGCCIDGNNPHNLHQRA
jgi:hypothetical protein